MELPPALPGPWRWGHGMSALREFQQRFAFRAFVSSLEWSSKDLDVRCQFWSRRYRWTLRNIPGPRSACQLKRVQGPSWGTVRGMVHSTLRGSVLRISSYLFNLVDFLGLSLFCLLRGGLLDSLKQGWLLNAPVLAFNVFYSNSLCFDLFPYCLTELWGSMFIVNKKNEFLLSLSQISGKVIQQRIKYCAHVYLLE